MNWLKKTLWTGALPVGAVLMTWLGLRLTRRIAVPPPAEQVTGEAGTAPDRGRS